MKDSESTDHYREARTTLQPRVVVRCSYLEPQVLARCRLATWVGRRRVRERPNAPGEQPGEGLSNEWELQANMLSIKNLGLSERVHVPIFV